MPNAHRRGTYVVVGATGAVGHVVAAVLGAVPLVTASGECHVPLGSRWTIPAR